jgi:hypothetical protein
MPLRATQNETVQEPKFFLYANKTPNPQVGRELGELVPLHASECEIAEEGLEPPTRGL